MRTSALIVGILVCSISGSIFAASDAFYKGPSYLSANPHRPYGLSLTLPPSGFDKVGPNGGSKVAPSTIQAGSAITGSGDYSDVLRGGNGASRPSSNSGNSGSDGNTGGSTNPPPDGGGGGVAPGTDTPSGGDTGGGNTGGSGGDSGGGDTGGGDSGGGGSGGGDGGGGDPPMRVWDPARLHNVPQPPAALPSTAKQAVSSAQATLGTLPPMARNYSLSLVFNPSQQLDRTEAVKALTVLSSIPATDQRRLFAASPRSGDLELAKNYRNRIQQLASPEPLAFSGEKLVILVSAQSGLGIDAELHRMAHRSVSFPGATADIVLAGTLSGELDRSKIQPLGDAISASVTAPQAEWWFVGDAAAAMPATRLAFAGQPEPGTGGGGSALPAAGGSAARLTEQMGNLAIIAACPASLQLLKGDTAALEQLRLRKNDMSSAAVASPNTTLLEQVLSVAHPNVLVTQVHSNTEIQSALQAVASNPWYRGHSHTVLMVQGKQGTDLLLF